MMPRFLNGNSKDDLAPTTILIWLLITPFQIIRLFLGVILECHIAGSNPKKSSNLDLNSFVKKISGRRTNACFFLLIILIAAIFLIEKVNFPSPKKNYDIDVTNDIKKL